MRSPPAPSLRLTPELAENIRGLSFEGLKALPRRWAEFGGLITAAPSLPSLAVDLLFVRFEHRFGLSEEDIPRLADAAGQCREEGRQIAAYFRSSTRSNGVVDPEDRRAIAETCPEAAFAVIARPTMSGGAHIRIFRAATEDQWTVVRELIIPAPGNGPASVDTGAAQPQEALRVLENAAPPPVVEDATPVQVPESVAPLRALESEAAPRGPLVAIPSQETGSNPAVDVPRPAVWPFLRRRRLTALVSVAAILFLSGVVFVATRNVAPPQSGHVVPASRPSPQPFVVDASAESQLGLAVRQEGGQVHLTWRRDSLAARTATSGILQILDGASPVSIKLAASDLTEGSVVYTPHSQDVTFRLRLGEPPRPNAEEMIRVISAASSAPTGVPAETAKASAPPSASEIAERRQPRPAVSSAPPPSRTDSGPLSSPAVVHDSAPQPPATAASNPQTAQIQTAQIQPPQIRPLQTQTAQALPTQTQTAQTTLPSDAARQNSLPAAPEPAVTRRPQLATPLRPEPAPAVTAPSVPGNALPAASPTTSAASDSPAVGYPTPLRRVEPALAGTRWKVTQTSRVDILVFVDAKGYVTDARPATAAKGISMFLEGLCLNAARQWTFKPATVAGKPVAGRYLIEFVFRPK